MAPTGGAIDMSLSFSTTIMPARLAPALFMASYDMPALSAPSPITATILRSSPFRLPATAIPSPAEIEVEE